MRQPLSDAHNPCQKGIAKHPAQRLGKALALALCGALLAACSAPGRQPGSTRVVLALDEAFVAARPALASDLQKGGLSPLPLLGPLLDPLLGGLIDSPLFVKLPLSAGAGLALDSANALKKKSGKRVVLATSPLVAKAILGGGTWAGDPPLLVPEWRGPAISGETTAGLWTAVTDPLPAYAAAGAAAGSYIAALAKEGGSPVAALLFSESPSRPRAALTAFANAYAKASNDLPLLVRELTDESGSPNKAPQADPSGNQPQNADSAVETSVKELFDSDIRLFFVALGSHSDTAIRRSSRPGLVLGADISSPETPPTLAFRIIPDDSGLTRALRTELSAIAGTATKGGTKGVPALLVPGPAAASIRVGKKDFASFLSDAALRAKAYR